MPRGLSRCRPATRRRERGRAGERAGEGAGWNRTASHLNHGALAATVVGRVGGGAARPCAETRAQHRVRHDYLLD